MNTKQKARRILPADQEMIVAYVSLFGLTMIDMMKPMSEPDETPIAPTIHVTPTHTYTTLPTLLEPAMSGR